MTTTHSNGTSACPKLTYFDYPWNWKAEAARLSFVAGDVAFDEVRLPFGSDEFKKLKESGALPYGQVPILQVNGKTITQASAIARFAAKKAGFYPKDSVDAARVDEVFSLLDELSDGMYPPMREQDEAKKKQKIANFENVTLPEFVGRVSKLLAKSRGKYVVDEQLTVADFGLMTLLQVFATGAMVQRGFGTLKLDSQLQSYVNTIESIPKVAAYIKKTRYSAERPKLTYFDIAWNFKVEAARLSFFLGGVDFEDVRIPHGTDDMQKLKDSGVLPFGQLPILNVEGKTITQASAIARYAGKRGGFYPEDEVDAVRVDEALSLFDELMSSVFGPVRTKDEEEKKVLVKNLEDTSYPVFVERATKMLSFSKGKYIVDDTLTFADFSLMVLVKWLTSEQPATWGLPTLKLEKTSPLMKSMDLVASIPKVAEWTLKTEKK